MSSAGRFGGVLTGANTRSRYLEAGAGHTEGKPARWQGPHKMGRRCASAGGFESPPLYRIG